MLRNKLFSNNLDYFSALYQTLNYAQAARAIPMSYQGLKKAISSLERDLGVTLFERKPNGDLIATNQAEILDEQIRSWVQDTRALDALLSKF